MKHRGNNPKRRIAKQGHFMPAQLAHFSGRARCEGSAHHKLHPADFGFLPPVNVMKHRFTEAPVATARHRVCLRWDYRDGAR